MRRQTVVTVQAAALGAVVWFSASTSAASSTYPEVVQDRLDTPCAPSCTLCHRDTTGGMGTAIKPFGQSLIEVGGAKPNDDQSLKRALTTLDEEGTDSDEDGLPDVDELREGRDPNIPGEGELCPVRYGCGARVAPENDSRGPAELLALGCALALFWLRSRKRVSPPRR